MIANSAQKNRREALLSAQKNKRETLLFAHRNRRETLLFAQKSRRKAFLPAQKSRRKTLQSTTSVQSRLTLPLAERQAKLSAWPVSMIWRVAQKNRREALLSTTSVQSRLTLPLAERQAIQPSWPPRYSITGLNRSAASPIPTPSSTERALWQHTPFRRPERRALLPITSVQSRITLPLAERQTELSTWTVPKISRVSLVACQPTGQEFF